MGRAGWGSRVWVEVEVEVEGGKELRTRRKARCNLAVSREQMGVLGVKRSKSRVRVKAVAEGRRNC